MNIIKKQGWLPLLLMGVFLTSSQAQVDPEQREARLAAFRAEVFTRVLNLTPEEAQQFWPVYNEYTDRREQIQQDLKANKQLDQMSDTEVEEQIRRHFEMKQRELDLEKDAYQKLRKVLPLRKVAKLPAAEREFRESLVKKLQEARERRQDRQQMRPGRNRR
ncbi:MAG TPA: hypothetical protein VK168_13795 [Saprospiraceae bacterium]|nr:hypothetical protein [Saprospiraceae bacterium]